MALEFALGILPKRGTTETLGDEMATGYQLQANAVAKTAAKPGKPSRPTRRSRERSGSLAPAGARRANPTNVGQLATVISNTGGLQPVQLVKQRLIFRQAIAMFGIRCRRRRTVRAATPS